MKKKLLILSCALVLLSAMVLLADTDKDRMVIPIQEVQSLLPPTPSPMAACSIVKHLGTSAWAHSGLEAGMQIVVYHNPAIECAVVPTYPFEITTFSFTLYDYMPGTVVWPAMIDVVVYDMAIPGDSCGGPGAELCRVSVAADQASFETPAIGSVDFPTPCCVNGPFYVGIEFTAGTVGTTPSILLDDETIKPVVTCDGWVYDVTGSWLEWYSFWAVGYPLFWVDGETESGNCGAPCTWEPGDPHKMHYAQLPDEAGWDVYATEPMVLADDFECTQTGWIKDIHWWGSWKYGAEGVINNFVLSLHEDISADQSPTGYSMPGATLWEREIWDFEATPLDPPTMEGWYDPACDSSYADGDANCDGATLTVADLVELIRVLYNGGTPCPDFYTNSDLNGDCVVDTLDVLVYQDYFASGMAAFAPYGGYPVPACCGAKEVLWNDHQAYFQYDVCLDSIDWFPQDSGTIYWLNISAQVEDTSYYWGWKSSLDHFNDDAVWSYWGDLEWTDIYEPDPAQADTNSFMLMIAPDGSFLDGYGSDAFGDGWYYYPSEWWNIWFYDHPYDPTRYKKIHIETIIQPLDGGQPSWVEFAVNWSTAWWSEVGNPPGEERYPPLPGVDEALAIGRYTFLAEPDVNGYFVFDFMVPDYNPEWVSIDVRGYNIMIESGFIEHECISGKSVGDTSLDLSFVITGEPFGSPDSGACCWDDPTGMGWTCTYTTRDYCENTLGGVYEGDGVQCEGIEACCLPDNTCVMADALCCRNELGGFPQGQGSTCLGVQACCLPSGDCAMVDALCCVNELGGVPQGAGSLCGGMQACCLQGGACTDADSLCCINELGGVPQGAGTACTAPEACCFGDGSCQDLDPLCCTDMGGTPQGPGTSCATTVCKSGWEEGDPHKMHYPQLPDEAGWDVCATRPLVLADDWRCSETGWVKDVHWWGSWMNGAETEIDYFLLSIHTDIPAAASPTGYSMPGLTLWEREIHDFNPVALTPPTTEGWYNPASGDIWPDNHQAYYQYNVYLDSADWFWQTDSTIYWLNISAVYADTSYLWGWKSSINHFNDDAVWAQWGDLDWMEMYEPDPPDPIFNMFTVTVDQGGQFVDGFGENAYGDGWYYYPWYDWWNVWFYDHPFDYARHKTIHIDIFVTTLAPGPAWLELAVNWSTDRWSLDFPGIDRPPLPGEDEDLYIGREVLFASDFFEGHYALDFVIPWYNPEWVSIDVRGFNFMIMDGIIVHECIGTDPQSMDLSFVITGDTIGGNPDLGACCPGNGDCELLTEADCLALDTAAVFRGVGTTCLGDSEPNGYDDACECCGLYTGGITGNCNCSIDGKLTLSDITRLIDRVYISKLPLCCEKNGNCNGSADEKITLSDITVLIDAVYISKIPPQPCIP